MFGNILCPISVEKIDSNVSRLTTLLNVFLMIGFLVTLNPLLVMIVTMDYFIRAFFDSRYSPIRFIAFKIASALNLQKKPIGLAQKVFASRLGFLCAAGSLIFLFTGNPFTSQIVLSLLMVLSTLDSVFNYCVGCLIYNYIVYPLYSRGHRS